MMSDSELERDLEITQDENDTLAGEVEDCYEREKDYETLAKAARAIYRAVEHKGEHICPHGNGTRYPTHAWFCDECFNALGEALNAVWLQE